MVRKSPRVEPTDDWQEILPLCWWPEQVEYERIRQPVLFGSSVPERAEETGVSERTLQRRIESFEEYGIEGFLSANTTRHRKEGRCSPSEVLSWVKTPRYREEDLARAFFSARHTRTLDGLGYLVLQRFRLYVEEGLAGTEVAVWVQEDSLTVEYGGEALSRYEVECDPAAGVGAVGRLRRVKGHTLFETSIVLPQLRLFDLGEALGEEGWAKFLKLDEYAPRQARRPDALQQTLFPYTEAI